MILSYQVERDEARLRTRRIMKLDGEDPVTGVCDRVRQCVAVCCSVSPCVAMCCNVLQYVAILPDDKRKYFFLRSKNFSKLLQLATKCTV